MKKLMYSLSNSLRIGNLSVFAIMVISLFLAMLLPAKTIIDIFEVLKLDSLTYINPESMIELLDSNASDSAAKRQDTLYEHLPKGSKIITSTFGASHDGFYNGRNIFVSSTYIDGDIRDIYRTELIYGRFFTEEELNSEQPDKCVINSPMLEYSFGLTEWGEQPIFFEINDRTYEVIGVIESDFSFGYLMPMNAKDIDKASYMFYMHYIRLPEKSAGDKNKITDLLFSEVPGLSFLNHVKTNIFDLDNWTRQASDIVISVVVLLFALISAINLHGTNFGEQRRRMAVKLACGAHWRDICFEVYINQILMMALSTALFFIFSPPQVYGRDQIEVYVQVVFSVLLMNLFIALVTGTTFILGIRRKRLVETLSG